MLEGLPIAWSGNRQSGGPTIRVVTGGRARVASSAELAIMSADDDAVMTRTQTETLLTAAYAEYGVAIHSYVYHLLNSQDDADDITQDVFIKAHGHLTSLRDPSRLKSWLYRIATNLCMDHLRRRARHRRVFGLAISIGPEPDEAETPGPREVAEPGSTAAIDRVAERDHIAAAFRRMPPKYASCLLLHSAQGLSYREIADVLGITPGAAAVRLTRARDLFARHYDALRGEESR